MNLYQNLKITLDSRRPGFQGMLVEIIQSTEGWAVRDDLSDNFEKRSIFKDRKVICVQTPVFHYQRKDIQGVIWTYDYGLSLETFNIIPLLGNKLMPEEYNYILNQFVDVFVNRTAADYGAVVTLSKPVLDIKDYLGEEGEERLKQFSDWANKGTGNTHPNDFNRWCDFVLYSFHSNRVIPTDLLGGWLLENGWTSDIVEELELDYEYGINLLKHEHNRG